MASGPTTYPPIIDGMNRVRWWVTAIYFSIVVFYALDRHARSATAEGTPLVALVFVNSHLGYRI